MKQNIMKLTDDCGIEHEYEILTAFELSSTCKNYVVYTDNTKDEFGKLNVYAAIYDPFDDTVFEEIKNEEEWNIIKNILEKNS